MLGLYTHTSNIENHKIVVNKSKAHITTEVAESIADLVPYAKRSYLFFLHLNPPN